MKVAVWNFYEEITTNGFLFKNIEASIGAELLSAWNKLFISGAERGISFCTLDQVDDLETIDAIVFMDHPRYDSEIVAKAFKLEIKKYLIIYDCEVIKPDNWDAKNHIHYERVFTWNDSIVDGKKYIKSNFVIPRKFLNELSVLQQSWDHKNLLCMISGAKFFQHPLELYSARIDIINYFEDKGDQNFHLYGNGWEKFNLKNYRGKVDKKLLTLQNYKFSFAYENAHGIPGYITEKILDCFRAGVVPIYKGAPNIKEWIPVDCFIDANEFASINQIEEFILNISKAEHDYYLTCIFNFVNSEKFDIFSDEYFGNVLCSWLLEDFKEVNPKSDVANIILDQMTEKLPLGNSDCLAPEIREINVGLKHDFPVTFNDNKPPRLVIYIAYGPELPVFIRARSVWQFYKSFFPELDILFVKESQKLEPGEVFFDGFDLNIGMPPTPSTVNSSSNEYAKNGIWGANENWRQIKRQMIIYDYLLRTREAPFYVYQSTVTSVIDLRALQDLISTLPMKLCFAGMPSLLTSPAELSGLISPCGTNTIFTNDLLELMRARYDPSHAHTSLPNDVWASLTLYDITKIGLPFFSFVKPRIGEVALAEVDAMVSKLTNFGHFHFRVKTNDHNQNSYRREDVDPWIMIKIIESIVKSNYNNSINIMYDHMAKVFPYLDIKKLPFSVNTELFGGKDRRIPFNDNEL